MKNNLIVICGGGGFIGGHLMADFRRQGYANLGSVDIKPTSEWYQRLPDVENVSLNLQDNRRTGRRERGWWSGRRGKA